MPDSVLDIGDRSINRQKCLADESIIQSCAQSLPCNKGIAVENL